MRESPTLSIVTVTWNSSAFIAECITSASNSARSIAYEHIVLDNASSDGSADLVERRFPDVTLIRNPSNVGFSRGNNVAVSKARGRYVLFLNPDTVVLDDAIVKLVELLEQNSDIGVVGPKLLDANLHWSRDMGDKTPTIVTVLNEYLGLSRITPFPTVMRGIVRNRDLDGVEECDWISGACFLVRREVLDQESWNEDVFFFGEDIEYCERIRRGGWRICCTGDARVVHDSGQSMSKQSLRFLAGRPSGVAVCMRRSEGKLAAWLGIRFIRLSYFARSLVHRARYWVHRDPRSLRKSRRLYQYAQLDSGAPTEASDPPA